MVVLLALAILVVGCADGDDAAEPPDGAGVGDPPAEVQWGACDVDGPAGIDLGCGTIEVGHGVGPLAPTAGPHTGDVLTVMTTLPRAWPSVRYRMASGTSGRG